MSEVIKPEDLLVTEGPNKGNIKDKSLAEIGAEEENAFRGGESTFLNERDRVYHSPDSAGKQKMFNEVFDRSKKKIQKEGVLEESYQDDEAEKDAVWFYDEQNRLSNERKQKTQEDFPEI